MMDRVASGAPCRGSRYRASYSAGRSAARRRRRRLGRPRCGTSRGVSVALSRGVSATTKDNARARSSIPFRVENPQGPQGPSARSLRVNFSTTKLVAGSVDPEYPEY
jgi:hypothetical protein